MNFTRRSFLQSATLAAIAVSLPIASRSSRAAQVLEPSPQLRNPGYYRFKLGSYEMVAVSDGVLSVPAALFAGNAPPEQLAEVLKAAFASETLTPDCNALYVNTGQNKVLIDTGSGFSAAATAGKLLDNLQAAQINPQDIDTVIITHAHGDHVGGLLDSTGKPVFANARFYVSRTEHDFWLQPQVSLPKIGIDANFQQTMISTAKKQLSGIKDRTTLFEMNQEIIPGFTALPTPGHTPGHIAVRIVSGNQSLTHTSDVVHTPQINLWHPEWHPLFDADPEQASTTRQQTLAKIAADRELMFAYHFPFPGLGHLLPRAGGGFNWEPINWQFET